MRVRSAHFEVLSDARPERARSVAVGLEQFRRVLAAALARTPQADDTITVVIAFRDQGSFAPFLPLYRGRPQDVEGYFQADRTGTTSRSASGRDTTVPSKPWPTNTRTSCSTAP